MFIMRHYSLAIGCITALLILSTKPWHIKGSILAAPRLIDNVIGGAIVLLGYGFIWPQWRGKEIHNQARCLEQFKKLVRVLLANNSSRCRTNFIQIALTKQRAAMLTAESDLELIYNEMQQEPKHSRRPSLLRRYVEPLPPAKPLPRLLIPLVRKGTQYQGTQQIENVINNAMDALINAIRNDNRVHELPTLSNKTDVDHLTSTTGQHSVEEIIWLALMTIKQCTI